MPSSSLFLRSSATFVSVLSLLTAPANAYSSDTYALDTSYAGDTFFDGFDFYTDADKSHGFVTYVDENTAKSDGLIKSGDDGSVIIGVDSTNKYDASQPYWLINGVGRPSVRITSTKKYNHGLFIADIAHMPGGVCGTWPGFWTLGDGTWPYHGEIDILEGANDQATQLSALHTAGTCSIGGESASEFETGTIQAANCTYDVDAGANGAGCGVSAPAGSKSYGLDFNSNNGGVYAMQWTSDYIKIWFWPRGSVPADVLAGTPTPDSAAWGTPTSNFQGGCDLDSNFINQQIVFDVTFCGDWAGNTWGDSCAAKTGVSTCAAFVANNPSAFADMYWDINSVKVYQLAPPTSTPSSTPSSTLSSTPSSSATTTPTLTTCSTTASASTSTNGSCPAWTGGHVPPAYLTNLPPSVQSELPAWTGAPPPDWCSYTSWMQSYTSANSVYASCQAKATGNSSSSYSFPTPTGSPATPTGSCLAPTPTGNATATTPTGTSSSSTTPGATTGSPSYNTSPGAWSAWSSDPVTYIASTTTTATSWVPLTTGSAQSSLLAPPMGGDGGHAGTITADGSAYTWGSGTSTDPSASKTTTTTNSATTTWASWSDPSSTSTSTSTSTTTTWASWTDPSSTYTIPTTIPSSNSIYTKTSWTYDPASSSIYWSWVGSSSASTLSTSSTTSTSTSTSTARSTSTSWATVSTSSVTTTPASAVTTGASASWQPVDPSATSNMTGIAPFKGAASSVSVGGTVTVMGYVALAVVGLGFLGILWE